MSAVSLEDCVGLDQSLWPELLCEPVQVQPLSQPNSHVLGIWPSGQGGHALQEHGRLRALQFVKSHAQPLPINHAVRPFVKCVTFVPETHWEKVRNALSQSGAGHIGQYSGCSWSVSGEGNFVPEPGSQPFLGTVGKMERVVERRLEMIVPKWRVEVVQQALLDAHPYEEVAFDWVPLDNALQFPLGYSDDQGWWWAKAVDTLMVWALHRKPNVIHVEKISWEQRLRLKEAGIRVVIMEPGELLLPGVKNLLRQRKPLWDK